MASAVRGVGRPRRGESSVCAVSVPRSAHRWLCVRDLRTAQYRALRSTALPVPASVYQYEASHTKALGQYRAPPGARVGGYQCETTRGSCRCPLLLLVLTLKTMTSAGRRARRKRRRAMEH
eukprot:234106-Rhodomonas_salina.1